MDLRCGMLLSPPPFLFVIIYIEICSRSFECLRQTQSHHYSALGKRIDHLEQERRKTRKPSEQKTEALHQTTAAFASSALSVNTSFLAPTAFACASVFIGSYLFARSRTHARLLRQWQQSSVSMNTRLQQSGNIQTQRVDNTLSRIQIKERAVSGQGKDQKTRQKVFKEFDQISIM